MFRTAWPLVAAFLASFMAGCGTSEEPSPLPCAYTVTVSPASFGAAGGTGSATVNTTAACSWTARADAGWLTIAGATNGTGGGNVSFSVGANAETSARSGSLTVAGQTLSIQQEAAPVVCAFTISPSGAATGKDGGTGTFTVATNPSCGWTAAAESSWLSVTGGQNGTGDGTVTYAVARNTQTVARTGTIRAAGQSFSVTQSGDIGACAYSVTPVEVSACMPSTERSTRIETQTGCSWTASAGAPWITITAGSSGSGGDTITFRVSDNWAAPRSGVVMVRWPTPTAGQNVQVAQAGCYYAVSRDSFSFAGAGGSSTFEVVQQSEPYTCGGPLQNACVWTAVSDVAWITVTSSMPRSGDDRVAFTVAANATGASRTGAITVRDRIVRITQSGS